VTIPQLDHDRFLSSPLQFIDNSSIRR